MKNNKRKMIAPIIITGIVLLYYFLLFIFIINIPGLIILKIIVTVASLFISGVMLSVLGERIREIKGGEEDDLSKY